MVTIAVRQGGRRYRALSAAPALVAVAASVGVPAAPPQTVAHRRYPQTSVAPARRWMSTSVGSPAAGGGGGGTGAFYIFDGAVIS